MLNSRRKVQQRQGGASSFIDPTIWHHANGTMISNKWGTGKRRRQRGGNIFDSIGSWFKNTGNTVGNFATDQWRAGNVGKALGVVDPRLQRLAGLAGGRKRRASRLASRKVVGQGKVLDALKTIGKATLAVAPYVWKSGIVSKAVGSVNPIAGSLVKKLGGRKLKPKRIVLQR